MTVIEFFNRTPIKNILSTLTVDFSKIIFVGENKLMRGFKPIYEDFAESRGIKAEICYRGINRNNLFDIVDVLSEIVEQEDECYFDLTGGDDLALVAMGIVFERYRHKNIQMERINLNTLKASDCDNDNKLISVKTPEISIEEFISLHGGRVCYTDDTGTDYIGTYKWSFTKDFIDDINSLWQICREDPKRWNQEIGVIIKMCEMAHNENKLDVSVKLSALEDYVKVQNSKYVPITELLYKLEKISVISSLKTENNILEFSFKNHQIKKCLTKAGTVLELKVTVAAMTATRKDDSHVYNEVMNGVCIDWDGGEQTAADTLNEIDVIMLNGLTPIFVSCKNGHIDDDELYKLESVANRFGGEKVKKVLIATYFGKQGESKRHFIKRAEDMGIEFIEQAHSFGEAEFNYIIKQLVNS